MKIDVAVPLCSEALIHGELSLIDLRNCYWLAAVGRLKPGVTIEQANAEMAALSTGILEVIQKSARQSENGTYRGQLESRRGAAGVLCDDGRGGCERIADRRPRNDKGFEKTNGKRTNL